MNADDFSPAELERIRSDSFVRQIEYHRELPSTNDLAVQLARTETFDTPLLVLTEQQTAGRGRGVNQWWSTSGSLTFSLVINTDEESLPSERWPRMSLTVGLAVCEAIRRFAPREDVGLKWPNDVFLAGRKVCGVLVEVPAPRNGRIVIGIGINVNNSFTVAPAELRNNAVSLYDVTRDHFELPVVLLEVLAQIERHVNQLQSGSEDLAKNWHALCILSGRAIEFDTGTYQISGICRGVDNDGALLIEGDAGIERVYGGVVTHFERP